MNASVPIYTETWSEAKPMNTLAATDIIAGIFRHGIFRECGTFCRCNAHYNITPNNYLYTNLNFTIIMTV